MQGLSSQSVVAVIGAGTMGAGIAQVAATFGHQVLLFDQVAGAAEKGIEGIDRGLVKLIERGKMSREAASQLIARIRPVNSLSELSTAVLVIEAIVERLEIKQKLFQQLEELCDEKTILASNTSSLSITAIASALKHGWRVVGMHFFNPAPVMKLVEVISGLQTSREVADIVYATAIQWGKQAVHAKSTPGFIVNRVARPFYAEALRIYQEGAAQVATIDAIMRESGGFRMGPFELMDLIGQDINYAVTSSVHGSYYGDQRFTPSLVQQELLDAGYLGRKSGRGFYDYSDEVNRSKADLAETQSAPEKVVINGNGHCFEAIKKLVNASNLTATFETSQDELTIYAGAATLKCTDGRMATAKAAIEQVDNLIVFDLALDIEKASLIAVARADQASPQSLQDAIGFWQALGKKVSVIDDVPGMCVMRTVCMLTNEGADAVNQGVCDVSAVDVAMKSGVNYPQGPMAWGEAIGLPTVVKVLGNLQATYGEDRYRVSPLLQRKLATEQSLL